MNVEMTELYTLKDGTMSLTEYLVPSTNKHCFEVKDEDEVLYDGESFQNAKSLYDQLCRE